MSQIPVSSDQAPRPSGAYSQGILAGGFLYTAGFGPDDPATGAVVGDAIEEQTAQVMRNIAAVLAVHGLNFSHVINTTAHLQHPQRDFPGFNQTYETFVTAPYPVRTTVGSELSGILVEIDVVAAHPKP